MTLEELTAIELSKVIFHKITAPNGNYCWYAEFPPNGRYFCFAKELVENNDRTFYWWDRGIFCFQQYRLKPVAYTANHDYIFERLTDVTQIGIDTES